MSNDAASAGGGTTNNHQKRKEEKRHRSIFEVPSDFFDSCRLLQSPTSFPEPSETPEIETLADEVANDATKASISRWSCNTCKAEFESLQDQRSHFKSDIHRFNVKLSIAGKDTVKEEDFDELTSDSLFRDYDISSISGSEDEDERGSFPQNNVHSGLSRSVKQKLYIHLPKGERVSIWKCLLLNEADNILFENDKLVAGDDGGFMRCLREKEVIEKLKFLIHEPRDNTHLRILLLASGGHFAGCVFDGNSVVAHKTFHRYVVRAKAGKKQSSKDATGRAAHSAGASLRRYNELALKKEIQELLAAWKPYFDASSCVFIYAPSNNRQLLFDGEKPYFSCKHCVVQNVPMTVRRPTLKESQRLYNLLTQVSYEINEENKTTIKEESLLSVSITNDGCPGPTKEDFRDDLDGRDATESCSGFNKSDNLSSVSESEDVGTTTPLHDAAKSGNTQKVLELLELGLDPCSKDERGRTPYMLATEKEVRNAFRRFMASNLDKWDWNAAKVPSALTKELEESQASKQAEKDAKKKARAKELKKLRKAREKKAQAEAAPPSQSALTTSKSQGASPVTGSKGQSQSSSGPRMSKEEELKRAQAAEREKRAAAAERRIAATASLNAQTTNTNTAPSSSSQPKGVVTTDIKCSCCDSSLVGKVPFHRYNYKYCSTSCMHVHREMLEDE
ncbi:Ankyrin repeat and zinc finger domain-containing protein 1 [Camellia lanceoleosa]|uniref:Ankyrin repeat and zinc finger domain-containing protein 1 n=1 Tax=Camellia lanceoleosa TaxID=1840588 RepID=A0ACC0INP5_9ERIC|nr:Ankyrin repeat and zinc finger domain-containing protein 1 [Camellia lanceoleosa]